MPMNPYNHEPDEPMVTISLSRYTEMVRTIQRLEDQKQIDKLQQDFNALQDKYNATLCELYTTKEKLKKEQSNESV